MPRAILFVLDSFGIGGAPDAARFGSAGQSDQGACTFGHIAEKCAMQLPTMKQLGLGHAAYLASGDIVSGFEPKGEVVGLWGTATEKSSSKDTPSGHWELAGVPVLKKWGYFPNKDPAFPLEFLQKIYDEAGLKASLCNEHSSGLVVLKEYGVEHMKSGNPIFYTSMDSVLQIAAHEETFGREALYRLCEVVFRHTAPLNIARVIARPFTGKGSHDFKRTDGRRDYSIRPPEATLLDRLKTAGRDVCAIGKVADIFAHQGPTEVIKAHGNDALFEASLQALGSVADGGLIFTNFVDFDQLYGHRRDVAGYASALEKLDGKLASFMAEMRDDDLLIITADHGCDPTWPGTEHTRERVPVLVFGKQISSGSIGIRESFADVGESIATWLGIEAGRHGTSFL